MIQKENRAEKSEKVQKERMLEGSKEKITPSSHTASRRGEAEPSFGEASGTLRQTTNKDREATVVVPEVDVVYPLHGDSAKQGESTSGCPAAEPPINRPSERHPESDIGGINSVVRIRGIVIALTRRVRGRRLRALIDLGSTGNYLSA